MMRRKRSIVLSILCVLTLCGLCFGLIACENKEHVHTEVTIEGRAATCEVAGLTEGKKCSECGVTLVAQEVIPALGHDLKDVVRVAPTCTQPGSFASRYCTRCTYTEGGGTLAALGHDMQPDDESFVPASCETAGKEADMKCTRCGAPGEPGAVIEALGHIVAEDAPWVVDTNGTQHYKECTRPNCDKGGKVDVAEHTPLGGETAFVQGGEQHYQVCATCEGKFNYQDHTSEEVGYVAPTCVRAGCENGTQCTVCKQLLTIGKAIPATGHSDGYNSTWLTDEATGSHYHKCTNPQCDFADGKVDLGAHVAEDPDVYLQKEGENKHYQICTLCSLEFNVAEHRALDASVFKNVTEEGEGHTNQHYQECMVCGVKTYSEHTMQDVAKQEPTCTAVGHEAGQRCSGCGYTTDMQEIAKKEHELEEVADSAKAANCVATGKNVDKKCKYCEYIEEGAAIKALGHDVQDKTWKQEEGEDGVMYHYQVCARDGCDADNKANYAAHVAKTWSQESSDGSSTTGSTPNDQRQHYQTCTTCKERFNEGKCDFTDQPLGLVNAGCGYSCKICDKGGETLFAHIEQLSQATIDKYKNTETPIVFTQHVQNEGSSNEKRYHTYNCPVCGTEVGGAGTSRCTPAVATTGSNSDRYGACFGVHYCDENYDWSICRYCGWESPHTPHTVSTWTKGEGDQLGKTHTGTCATCNHGALHDWSDGTTCRNNEEQCKINRVRTEDCTQNESTVATWYNYLKHANEWKHDILCKCGAALREEECTVTYTNYNEWLHSGICDVCKNYTTNTSHNAVYEAHTIAEGDTGACTANGCGAQDAHAACKHALVYDEKGFTDGTCSNCGTNLLWTLKSSSSNYYFSFNKEKATELSVTKLKIPSSFLSSSFVESGKKTINNIQWRRCLEGATMLKAVYVEIGSNSLDNTIMSSFFSGCTSLETVIFGENFNILLGNNEFEGCTALKNIIFLRNDPIPAAGNWQAKPFGDETAEDGGMEAVKNVVKELNIYFNATPTALGAKCNVESAVYAFYPYVKTVDETLFTRIHFGFENQEAATAYEQANDAYFASWNGLGVNAFRVDLESGTTTLGDTFVKVTALTQPETWKKAAAAAAANLPEAILPTAAKETVG